MTRCSEPCSARPLWTEVELAPDAFVRITLGVRGEATPAQREAHTAFLAQLDELRPKLEAALRAYEPGFGPKVRFELCGLSISEDGALLSLQYVPEPENGDTGYFIDLRDGEIGDVQGVD